MRITVENDPDPRDIETVNQGLAAFNVAHTSQDARFASLRLFVRDDDGTVRGGLLGGTYWGWLYVAILWLDDDLRGQGYGSQLMATAERIARERGCHAAHLDTMSFQALGFYLKLGYTVFGQLDDLPRGHSRIFLQKSLE
jgi:GNAT superfamily N-acetyltransferase